VRPHPDPGRRRPRRRRPLRPRYRAQRRHDHERFLVGDRNVTRSL